MAKMSQKPPHVADFLRTLGIISGKGFGLIFAMFFHKAIDKNVAQRK